MIEQMEAQVRLQLDESTAARPRARITSNIEGIEIEVRAYRLRNSRTIYGYCFGGVRLERSALLQLLQTDTKCPQCQLTQKNWREFRGEPIKSLPTSPFSFQFRHLAEEVNFELKGNSYTARPATLQCLSVCSASIHSPAIVKRAGWDVFSHGNYLAGGLTIKADASASEPTFPRLEDARRWLVSNLTTTSQIGGE